MLKHLIEFVAEDKDKEMKKFCDEFLDPNSSVRIRCTMKSALQLEDSHLQSDSFHIYRHYSQELWCIRDICASVHQMNVFFTGVPLKCHNAQNITFLQQNVADKSQCQ